MHEWVFDSATIGKLNEFVIKNNPPEVAGMFEINF
jgi:hypothetical protein